MKISASAFQELKKAQYINAINSIIDQVKNYTYEVEILTEMECLE